MCFFKNPVIISMILMTYQTLKKLKKFMKLLLERHETFNPFSIVKMEILRHLFGHPRAFQSRRHKTICCLDILRLRLWHDTKEKLFLCKWKLKVFYWRKVIRNYWPVSYGHSIPHPSLSLLNRKNPFKMT